MSNAGGSQRSSERTTRKVPGAGLDDVLVHAKAETRQAIEKAIQKKQVTGQSLVDILRQDVDRTLFKNVWEFLNKPIGGTQTRAEEPEKKVKDVLVEKGLVSSDETEEHGYDPDEYDPVVARIMIDSGEITEQQLNDALAEQVRGGQPVWRILVNHGIVSPKQISDARKRATATPGGRRESPLDRLKSRLHGAMAADQGVVTVGEDVGVVTLVASIIEGAVNSRATDIHLEPQSYGLRVRYRIDGMLYDIMNLSKQVEPEVISRVKVLGAMDITEKRHPQDGRFSINVADKEFNLRVATLPTILGEKIVLRLLNPEDVFLGLRELGLEAEQLQIMQEAIHQPHGMLLVTGPIGSGKTTTLYSILSEIDIFTRNVVTIEDPVEYQLPGINQVQVDVRHGRGFADMLRSVVRQDANVMMVGEIRDPDTANVAVRAAMTGHQVFSTLHTNDAVGAIDTLTHLKIPPYLITSAVTCIVAQRLVRKVCQECAEVYDPSEAMLRAIGMGPTEVAGIDFKRAVGCNKCYETGYRGRTGIYEVFKLDPESREMVLRDVRHDELLAYVRANGMSTLLESGVNKIRAGTITIEELLRVSKA